MAAKKTTGKSEPKSSKEEPKKIVSKPKKEEDDDLEDDDEEVSLRKMIPGIPISKNSIFPSRRPRKQPERVALAVRKQVKATRTICQWRKILKTWIFLMIRPAAGMTRMMIIK
jgi:hypothetical protein